MTTTTPKTPFPDDDKKQDEPSSSEDSQTTGEAVGVEIGMSKGEGSTFEPEEDDEVRERE